MSPWWRCRPGSRPAVISPNAAAPRLACAASGRTPRGKRLEDAVGAAWGGVPPGLDLKLVVTRGEPGPALVGTADSADDLLVVGAGRRGVLSRLWRGRVSRYCLSHARCPVLAIPQPSAREMGLGPGVWPLRHRALSLDRALREWDTAA